MAFFLLPPPQFIADNQEIPKQVILQAQNYQKNLLAELNITSKVSQVREGAYAGSQIFNWDQKYNAILITSFIFQKGKSFKKEWMRTATLVKQENCTYLGSVWSFNDKKIIPFPIENSNVSLSSIASRTFKPVSPVKLDLQTHFSDARFENVFNLIFQEELAKKNVPVISDLARYFCKTEKLNNEKFTQNLEYSARPHRVIEIIMQETGKKGNSYLVSYEYRMNSSVFGEKDKKNIEKKEQEIFNPVQISDNIAQKVVPALHDLSQSEFKIIKRVGSWVYINRGRAYGLLIGMRLTGAGAGLHIIRYAPELTEEPDASIAFIRYENKQSPLAPGDILKIDQTVYPK